ncbi:MAG: glycosyltransferase family 2 protein [Burkholderiales bacterium]|jgi:polyisoprenyl-phosphate glycosyltransferase|nr:glycosyltransferase family 2 protein [Burkholderiales bacterium]
MKSEPALLLQAAAAPAPRVSVVVPLYNEQEVLPALHRRLVAALADLGLPWEIVYVDDGSRDATAQLLRQLHVVEPTVGFLRLSRNFGKEAAMSAGLRAASGDAVVILDADLQDPPELLPAMLQAWRQGADVVNMRRRSRQGETWFKRATAHAFYRVINRLSDVPIPEDVGDFRLLSRCAVDALNQLPERNRFMKGLFAWIGFEQVTLEYDRAPRAAGTTKWRYRKLWAFALEGITGFSVAPLKLASYSGFLIAGGAFLFALHFVIKTWLFSEPVAGFPTLIVTISLLGGLQLIAIGVLGEYLGRLFMESKQRPLYLVDEYRAPAGGPQPSRSTTLPVHAG